MPPIEIEQLGDASATTPSDQGFIRVKRLTLRTRYEDGSASQPYKYDVADRNAIDAVLMLLHAPRDGAPLDPYVCMRTALRPPVALRQHRQKPIRDARTEPVIWELPAGLIEPDEEGESAVMNTASRETEEEVGLQVPPSAFQRLGVAVYLSPGLIAEKLHIVRAEVDHQRPVNITATEVVEAASRVEWWPLSEALANAERGVVEDCKTELALRRFAGWIASQGNGR